MKNEEDMLYVLVCIWLCLPVCCLVALFGSEPELASRPARYSAIAGKVMLVPQADSRETSWSLQTMHQTLVGWSS